LKTDEQGSADISSLKDKQTIRFTVRDEWRRTETSCIVFVFAVSAIAAAPKSSPAKSRIPNSISGAKPSCANQRPEHEPSCCRRAYVNADFRYYPSV
jgi:hypothetical protein